MLRLRLGHSPDSDDAFMFWGLASGRVTVPGIEFEHILRDIETLNEWALEERLEITAVSAHAYAYVHDRYLVLPHGASMGDGYGPKIVTREPVPAGWLAGRRIGIPGRMTSAFLAMGLWWAKSRSSDARLTGSTPEPEYVSLPFDQIMDAVKTHRVDAGLLIHEGQLTYGGLGLHEVVDLGGWWKGVTGLPLPLGINVIRADLPPEVIAAASQALRRSIEESLANRGEALAYALQFARGLPHATADAFVGMYVNNWTVDMGPCGREALQRFLSEASDAGLAPRVGEIRFAD